MIQINIVARKLEKFEVFYINRHWLRIESWSQMLHSDLGEHVTWKFSSPSQVYQ